jgi:hypothetical protein
MLAKLALKTTGIFLVIFMLPAVSSALLIAGGLGLGSSTTKNQSTETEAPFTQVYTVERAFHSRLALGVEHLRSLKASLTSSISYTGLISRYYINASPMPTMPPEETSTEQTTVRDFCYFIGTGFGNAQSSRLPDPNRLSSNAAGVYISPRAGVDYQLGKHLGARGEFIYAQMIFGTGALQTMSLSAGLYWLF